MRYPREGESLSKKVGRILPEGEGLGKKGNHGDVRVYWMDISLDGCLSLMLMFLLPTLLDREISRTVNSETLSGEAERRTRMKRIKRLWMMGVGLAVAMLWCNPVYAGFYFESEQITAGVPGHPHEEKLIKTYLMKDVSRTDQGDIITIMNYQTMMSYELHPKAKTYIRHDMNKMGGMPDMGGEEKAQFQQMMKRMADSMKIVPSDETKTIAGFDCRKYDVQFMMASGAYWVTQKIEGYEELRKLTRNMAEAFDQNPMMKQMNALALMDQMKGFPVQTIMNVMGGKITTTLKSIEQKELDKDLFEIPKGYTEIQNE